MNRSPLLWPTPGISLWDPNICHRISWKISQASRLYSLVTEVHQPGGCGDIWNHHSVSSIVHILWAAKCIHHKKGQMEYCWKAMENWQCGSQNHCICHIVWLKNWAEISADISASVFRVTYNEVSSMLKHKNWIVCRCQELESKHFAVSLVPAY